MKEKTRIRNKAAETSGRRSKRKKSRRVRYDQSSLFMRMLTLLIASLFVALIVEGFNQASVERTLRYLTEKTVYFLFNWMFVFATMSITELVKRRRALLITMSILWVVLGFANYMVCRNRTLPLVSGDLMITREILGMVTIYFSWLQIILTAVGILALVIAIIYMFSRIPRRKKINYAQSASAFAAVMCFTFCAGLLSMQSGMLENRFENRVEAYHNYGFTTCFTLTFGQQGIAKPDEYSPETVDEILGEIEISTTTQMPVEYDAAPGFSEEDDLQHPNIVFLQLESMFDLNTVIGAEFSEDPTPVYHDLIENWPTGELYVPTIGGGTANVEFEVMSGMNMDFFGAGETPYNTIIQEVTCETIAHILREHGYTSTALHNNIGTFFSRNEVYANLGYDRFDCLEYMLEPEYNEVGWSHDVILTDEILSAMENSESRDLIFAISVESHGKYADTYVPEEGDIEVLALPEGAYLAPFQNYVNVLPDVDKFIGEMVEAFEDYDEPVLMIIYGDHLPALGLDSEMLTTGDLYTSRYIIWNNYGAEFEAPDLQSYRLSAYLLGRLGISDGVMTRFHQAYPLDEEGDEYMEKLQTLEYDLLYGEQNAYGEQGPHAPTDLQLGIDPIVIESAEISYGRLMVTGQNFTEYSRIVCGNTVLTTVYVDPEHIVAMVQADDLAEGSICVAQINGEDKELGRTETFPVTVKNINKNA